MFEKLASILNKRSSAPQAQRGEHSLLIGMRNRLLVLFLWACPYLTFSRVARLIYGTQIKMSNDELITINPEPDEQTLYSYQSWEGEMTRKERNPGDPNAFYVHQGKLYVCSNPTAAKQFSSKVDVNIAKADKNWLEIGKRTYNAETRDFDRPWPFGPEGGAQ